jgi:hypothetical protein
VSDPGVAFVVLALNRFVPSSPRRRLNDLLLAPTTATVTAVSRDRRLRDSKRSGAGWLAIIAALVAGVALSFFLAQADVALSVPAAPADRRDAPPATRPGPLNQTPYVPLIRLGSRADNPGACAPYRDSVALRRNGELS